MDGARTSHLGQRHMLSTRAISIDMDVKSALETGGGRGTQMRSEREEGAVTGCRPLPGSGALSQGQPLPGYLFSIYWGQEKRSPAGVGQPLSTPSPPCLATLPPLCFFCATVTQGLGG